MTFNDCVGIVFTHGVKLGCGGWVAVIIIPGCVSETMCTIDS